MQELMAGLMSSNPPPSPPAPGSRPPPTPRPAMTGPPAPMPPAPNPPPEVDLALANTVAMNAPLGAPLSPTAPPAWMETSVVSPHSTRTGASPMKGSGLGTLFFFGLIGLAVAGAGIAGVVLWGPEKTVANRSHLASDPPPPQVLPSLPASADAPPADSASASPAAEPSAASAASAAKKEKARKWQKGRKTH